MAGLSLNNDFSGPKAPPPQMSPPVALQQQPYGNSHLPPQPQQQSQYPGKPTGLIPVALQQTNAQAPVINRPPMPMNAMPINNNNNPTSLPPQAQPVQSTNGAQPSQAPPTAFNGSTNQYPSQVTYRFVFVFIDCHTFFSEIYF